MWLFKVKYYWLHQQISKSLLAHLWCMNWCPYEYKNSAFVWEINTMFGMSATWLAMSRCVVGWFLSLELLIDKHPLSDGVMAMAWPYCAMVRPLTIAYVWLRIFTPEPSGNMGIWAMRNAMRKLLMPRIMSCALPLLLQKEKKVAMHTVVAWEVIHAPCTIERTKWRWARAFHSRANRRLSKCMHWNGAARKSALYCYITSGQCTSNFLYFE